MADERTCYAGDLTSDAIGKTISVTYGAGRITSTVVDVLKEIRHCETPLPAYPTASNLLDGSKRTTTFFFRNTRWTQGTLLQTKEVGLTVDDTLEVTVLS